MTDFLDRVDDGITALEQIAGHLGRLVEAVLELVAAVRAQGL